MHGGRTPSRGSQYDRRRRVSSDERSIRLDAEPQGLSQDSTEVGPTGSGHVCIQTGNSAEEVLKLETRPRSRSSGYLQPGLGQPTGKGLCQFPLEPSRQRAEQSAATTSHIDSSGPSMEEPTVVSHSTGHAGRFPNPPSTQGRSNHTNHPEGVPAVLPQLATRDQRTALKGTGG